MGGAESAELAGLKNVLKPGDSDFCFNCALQGTLAEQRGASW